VSRICCEISLQLDPSVNLVRQCVAGTGMVQINVDLKRDDTVPRVNIVDVLQPPEDSENGIGEVKNYFMFLPDK